MIRFNYIEGGRRTGKTTAAALIVGNAARYHDHYKVLWLTSQYGFDYPRCVIASAHRKVTSENDQLVFSNGSRILFRPHSSDNLRGVVYGLNMVVVDNAEGISEPILAQRLSTLTQPGAVIWLVKDTMTA